MRDGAPEIDPIGTPTRILWGERDPIVKSEWADCLNDFFSEYDFETVPNAGHFVHHERPDLANEEITRFFGCLG